MKKIKLTVLGMECDGCENRIRNSLKMFDGVLLSDANYKDNSVYVELEDEVDINSIKKLISNLGFEVEE